MSGTEPHCLPDAELFYRLKGEKEVAEAAFSELYARHGGRVYAYCLRFLANRDEALDVYQETFIRFFECAKQDREMTNVPAFLLKIARNLCLNTRRDKKRTVEFEDYQKLVQPSSPEKSELLQLITTALEMLPDDYREVFVLREYDGLSYAEIADVVDSSLSNVKVRIFRAKQKIREILSPYIEEFSE
ncbi:MAG: RNA polymerase sigma factor [Bacteroidetes bacterium]|nr:RNA polymerase sigma factor [Bacteroidota bacterium]